MFFLLEIFLILDLEKIQKDHWPQTMTRETIQMITPGPHGMNAKTIPIGHTMPKNTHTFMNIYIYISLSLSFLSLSLSLPIAFYIDR